MSKPTRIPSEEHMYPDADIILVSKDKYYYAVHKAKLCHSSVFRDMFDMPQAKAPLAIEGENTVDEPSSKRIKLTSEEGALPEVQMDEPHSILRNALHYFYDDNDDVDYESSPTLGLDFAVIDDPEHINVYMFARFFDKFNLRTGKASLVVDFPIRLRAIESTKSGWTNSSFADTLAIFFISSHFKLVNPRNDALRLLPRIAAALDAPSPSTLYEAIFLSNSLCFKYLEMVRWLYDRMLVRILNAASARSALEAKYLALIPTTTYPDCAGRSAVFRDWFDTRKFASPLDLDIGEASKSSLPKCACGKCGGIRRLMMRDLKSELGRIEAQFISPT